VPTFQESTNLLRRDNKQNQWGSPARQGDNMNRNRSQSLDIRLYIGNMKTFWPGTRPTPCRNDQPLNNAVLQQKSVRQISSTHKIQKAIDSFFLHKMSAPVHSLYAIVHFNSFGGMIIFTLSLISLQTIFVDRRFEWII